MNLNSGDTIFDKMKTTYDELRNSEDPVGEIVNYYRQQLKKGESLWWTGSSSYVEKSAGVPVKIRLWNTLDLEQKNELKLLGFIQFPELLSSSSDKYHNFSLWLAATHGVISTSIRDSFSAGGQTDLNIRGIPFKKVSRALAQIYENRDYISSLIEIIDETVLEQTWKVSRINGSRIKQWIRIINSLKKLTDEKTVSILEAIFPE